MNFKRLFVLALALIMALSVCAPVIYALDTDYSEAEINAELENVMATATQVWNYVSENYEAAYAAGYAYALENGYIDTAVDALDTAINAIEALDTSALDVSAEVKADLKAELDACAATLAEIKSVLENGEADDVAGLLAALVALEDDLYTHLENLAAICSHIDLEPVVAHVVANIEAVLAALETAINESVEAAKQYLVDALLPYYEAVSEIVDVTLEVYAQIVEAVAEIHATVMRVHAKLLEVNGAIHNTLEAIDNAVKSAVDTYVKVVALLVKVYENVEDAVTVAAQIYRSTVDFVNEYKDDAENAVVKAKELYNEVLDVIEAAYGKGKDAYAVALEVYAYVTELVGQINAEVKAALEAALYTHYVLDADSYYVSLGNADYANELAQMLYLGNKHGSFDLNGDYADAVAGADLVTVDFTDDELYDFAYSQVMGKLATIIRGNEVLMKWYDDQRLVGPAIRDALDELGIDINAEAQELDWSKYLDEEGLATLNSCLEGLKLQVIEAGIPEVYVLPLGELALEILAQNGYKFPGLSINIYVDIPVAELVVFLVENLLYKHAEFTYNVVNTLENVYELAPEATVVITGLGDPLAVMEDDMAEWGLDLTAVEGTLDAVVGALNLQLFGFALANENTIFVESANADDVYAALNFSCRHLYSDYCTDELCDLCGEAREVNGHVFENYVSNNDATCTKNGTETATCKYCDVTDTREDDNSMVDHVYSDATCKAPKTCEACGKTTGGYGAHTYGDWTVTIEPTNESTGIKEKTCTLCGYKTQEIIPMIEDNSGKVIAVIGIVVLAAAVVSGAVVGIYYVVKKKNNK